MKGFRLHLLAMGISQARSDHGNLGTLIFSLTALKCVSDANALKPGLSASVRTYAHRAKERLRAVQ